MAFRSTPSWPSGGERRGALEEAAMASRRPRLDDHPGPRHSPDWYDQSGEETQLRAGDRIFIACEGGPSNSRLELFPPRLEVPEHSGIYVLVDVGPRDAWRYVFVPRQP
jgi:hypothetical protein